MNEPTEPAEPAPSADDEHLAAWSREVLGAPVDVDPAVRDAQISRALEELATPAPPPEVVPLDRARARRRVLAAAAGVLVLGGVVGVTQLGTGSGGDDTADRSTELGDGSSSEADLPAATSDAVAPSPEVAPPPEEVIDLGEFDTVAALRGAVASFEAADRSSGADQLAPTRESPTTATDGATDCGLGSPLGRAVVAGRPVLVELATTPEQTPLRVVDAATCQEVG